MAEMTKRERIERTLNFQETDRVPLFDLLLNDGAIQYFSGEQLPPLVDNEPTRQTVDRLTGRAIAHFLDMTRTSTFGPLADRVYTDEDGFVMHVSAQEKTSWIEQRPFADEAGAAEYLQKCIHRWEASTREIEADPQGYRQKYHQDFREMQARIGDTVHLLAVQGTGLDDIRVRLGFALFAYVDADNPGIISEALEAATNLNIAICHAVADLELSPVVLTYGDIAYKDRLLHSPAWLQREFYPRLKRLNDAWHEHGHKCLFHSDGQLMPVLDDLIETGIDGLNPIEIVAGMSLKEVREQVGQRLFLAGGIDMSQLLSNGTPDEVRVVCRQAIRDAYPGFFMGSTTEADNSCKTENLIAMYEVATEGL